MSAPQTLEELYVHDLQDLWSANDQMLRVVGELADAADDEDLAEMLRSSQTEIQSHTDVLKTIIGEAGGDCEKAHCRGMEGLVKEARKHAIEEDFEDETLQDVAIIAQYQRMAHYGLAGFGTAAALAKALGREQDVERLETILNDIYSADRYLSRLAETSVNVEAAD